MKKLLRLLVALLLLAAAGYGWFRQSVHYALLELGRAAREGDVATVERHVDLGAFVDAGARFAAAVARVEGKRLGGDVLGALVGGLADTIGGELGRAARPEAIAELRREVARGDALARIGPFEPADGFGAIGAVDVQGREATVVVVGSCHGEVTSVTLKLSRVPGPLGLDVLGTWRATGIDEGSLLILAEACREGAHQRRDG